MAPLRNRNFALLFAGQGVSRLGDGLYVALVTWLAGFTSALTDIPLIALVQQRIPDRHLAKALGLWEAGIAGAIAIAPIIATTIINTAGVSTGFMLSGAALIVIGLVAALALNHTKSRGPVSSTAGGRPRTTPLPPATPAPAGDTAEHLTDPAHQQPADLISLTAAPVA